MDPKQSFSIKNNIFTTDQQPGCIAVNSAIIFHIHSSHLQFSTVHLLRKLDALNTINNFNFFVQ